MKSVLRRPKLLGRGVGMGDVGFLRRDALTLTTDFAREGFVVARGVLAAPEVARLRADALRGLERGAVPFALGTTVPNAAVECPEVGWIFHHPAILELVREALGDSDILFTMEAAVQRNLTSGWHKDTGAGHMSGGYYGCDDPFARDDCRVLKVGIYLQPHVDGRGLRVRRGSQTSPGLDDGEEVVLQTHSGDVVLFDVRLTHSGQVPERSDRAVAKVARVLPRSVRQRLVAVARRAVNRVSGRPDRLAVFFAFGPNVPATETYAIRNLAREHEQTGRFVSMLDPELCGAFRAEGVELLAACEAP